MNGKVVMDCIDAAYASIKQHADEIMVLDQTIGDGDHVFNLIRGLEALRGIRGDIEALDFGPALKLAASKVLSTVGGSSGPLFSSLLLGMSRASDHLNGDPRGYAQMYAAGVKAVQDRGRTGKGSKTMMDVLIPVAERLSELTDREPAGRRSSPSCRRRPRAACSPRVTCWRRKVARPFSASARLDTSIQGRGRARS